MSVSRQDMKFQDEDNNVCFMRVLVQTIKDRTIVKVKNESFINFIKLIRSSFLRGPCQTMKRAA